MADSDETAVLEVSSENKLSVLNKHERKDSVTDISIYSNYSTSLEGSVVASPSIESFSTLPDQEVFDFSLEARDLQVRVDSPQKHLDNFETYVTFRVTTRCSREGYDESEYVVHRRYNDFLWLRQKLVEAYPTHIIPALPGKHTLLAQLDRYSREFIVCRMGMLHRYLNRVACHPVLSSSSCLKLFLTAKPSEFSVQQKASTSLFGRVSSSLHNLAAVYMCRQRAPEFESIRDYLAALTDKLTTLERIGQRVHKERKECGMELRQLAPVFCQWSTLESEPLLSRLLEALSQAITSMADAQETCLLNTFQPDFAQPLKEFSLCIDSVKEALTRRDSFQIAFELTADEMAKKRVEKDMLLGSEGGSHIGGGFAIWKSASEVREDRLEKLDSVIPKLVKEAEANQDKLEVANEDLRSDLERWRAEKKNYLKNLLVKMADQHILYYQECLEALERVATTVNREPNLSSAISSSQPH